MIKTTEELFRDFCTFSNYQLNSGDIDPAYPVLREVFRSENLDREHQLWRLLLYVTYYHLGSAENVWAIAPDPFSRWIGSFKWVTFPALATGVERRGMRGNAEAVNKFLQSAYNRASFGSIYSLTRWVDQTMAREGEEGWLLLRQEFESIWGAGSWASYKWADLLKNVVGLPITADSIGRGGGSMTAGPVPGLALITGASLHEALDETFQREVYNDCLDNGVTFNGLDQFETALCDFNSMYKGRYYPGMDIDLMMTQLEPSSVCWRARRHVFSPTYLGELNGWTGVRDRLTMYRDHGRILWPDEAPVNAG